jgi:hypothetical protein
MLGSWQRAGRIRNGGAPLPEHMRVGAGIAVAGVAGYVFLSLAFRQLTTVHSKVDYTAVFGLWVVVFTIAPGFFQPLEQEVGRALAHRRAQGIGGAPLVKRAATLGGALAVLAILACIAAVVPITSRVFNDNVLLFVCLLIGIVAYYVVYIARGTLSGNGRFGPYGVMVGAEGVVRLVATIALIVIGSHAPGLFGLALVLPPIAALLISLRVTRLAPPRTDRALRRAVQRAELPPRRLAAVSGDLLLRVSGRSGTAQLGPEEPRR